MCLTGMKGVSSEVVGGEAKKLGWARSQRVLWAKKCELYSETREAIEGF